MHFASLLGQDASGFPKLLFFVLGFVFLAFCSAGTCQCHQNTCRKGISSVGGGGKLPSLWEGEQVQQLCDLSAPVLNFLIFPQQK